MMTDEQKSKVAELKATIAATAAAPSGVPREVRDAVVVLKKELKRAGTTGRGLAAALDIHETTLCRWEREARAGGKQAERGGGRAASFRKVQLKAETPTPVHTTSALVSATTPRGLRVAHARSGLVVDGLDVETLAALLRRLS